MISLMNLVFGSFDFVKVSPCSHDLSVVVVGVFIVILLDFIFSVKST